MRYAQITIAPGAARQLAHANDHDARLHRSFEGDLGQMGTQAAFLEQRGFDIAYSGGVAGFVCDADADRGIPMIYQYRIAGWWHYEKDLVRLGVCTSDEFRAELTKSCESEGT